MMNNQGRRDNRHNQVGVCSSALQELESPTHAEFIRFSIVKLAFKTFERPKNSRSMKQNLIYVGQ